MSSPWKENYDPIASLLEEMTKLVKIPEEHKDILCELMNRQKEELVQKITELTGHTSHPRSMSYIGMVVEADATTAGALIAGYIPSDFMDSTLKAYAEKYAKTLRESCAQSEVVLAQLRGEQK